MNKCYNKGKRLKALLMKTLQVYLKSKSIRIAKAIGVISDNLVNVDLTTLRQEKITPKKKSWFVKIESNQQSMEVPLDALCFSVEQKREIMKANSRVRSRDFHLKITRTMIKNWQDRYRLLRELNIPIVCSERSMQIA